MGFSVSPSITVSEIDQTGSIPAVSETAGAIAGVFRWGPVYQAVTVSSEDDLVAQFGPPTNYNAETWFTAADFLAYADNLLVVRGANTTSNSTTTSAYNAVATANVAAVTNAVAAVVLNADNYLTKDGTFDSQISFIAKYPGDMGNSLKVSVCDSAAAFQSNLAIVSTANIAASSNIAITVGSNTAVVAIGFTGGGTIADANTAAIALRAGITIGDTIKVGNTIVGTQDMRVSALGAVSTNSTIATFNISFNSQLSLHSNWSGNTIPRSWEYRNVVTLPPGQSAFVGASGNTAAKDEIHIVVIDEDGQFSGSPGSILETYPNLSRASNALDPEGGNIFFKTVINGSSKYLWYANDNLSASNTALNVVSSTSATPLTMSLVSGAQGPDEFTAAFADVARAYDLFRDPVSTDFGLLMSGSGDATKSNYLIDNISSVRKDCVVFASAPKAAVYNNVGGEKDSVVAWGNSMRSSSYSFRDSGYKYRYDKYNDVNRYTPLNGDMAGLAARTDQNNDAWWSPAGFNRGVIKNVIKLAWNPSKKADRDAIVRAGVNSVVTFVPEGTILFGDRTGLMTNSAFASLPVRRLFITIEKAIATAAKYSMFEFNDDFTQAQFRNLVIPYLRDIQGRRGIKKFQVICDGTNNTETVVNAEQFVADIYVQPNRSASKIQLNFIAVDKAVTFTESVGAA